MIYTVIKIEEDMDFGCEERQPGAPVMAVVTLRDEAGMEQVIRYPDQELYRKNIHDGDTVVYKSGKCLIKPGNMDKS